MFGTDYCKVNQFYGEGNGNPLQYSCLENPVEREAWWAAVHGVTQSQIQLKQCMHACKPVFFFNFILLFNFTILYWFCHISTWIRHRYIRVPHPEPSSLLPPVPSLWVIPVHQPQASSIVHQTWAGDSFHIWYYTCFYAVLPNHPTLSLSHRVQTSFIISNFTCFYVSSLCKLQVQCVPWG